MNRLSRNHKPKSPLSNRAALIEQVIDIITAEDIGLEGEMSGELFAEFSKDKATAGLAMRSVANIVKKKLCERINKLK